MSFVMGQFSYPISNGKQAGDSGIPQTTLNEKCIYIDKG